MLENWSVDVLKIKLQITISPVYPPNPRGFTNCFFTDMKPQSQIRRSSQYTVLL